jgi:DNA primase
VEDTAVTLEQNVTETILSYRLLLICKILEENMKNVSPDVTVDNTEFLTINQDFNQLRNVIAKKLGRVLVRF